MGLLTDAARDAATKRRFQTYSDAHVLIGIGLLGLAVAYLLFNAVLGGPVMERGQTSRDGAILPPGQTSPSGPGRPAPSPTAPTPTAAPTPAADVTLPDAAGGTATVPQATVDIAQAGVVALFTGDFTDVPLDGAAPPTDLRWPDPQVTDPTVVTAVDDYVVIRFAVDPDGPGPQSSRAITGAVRLDGTTWRFSV